MRDEKILKQLPIVKSTFLYRPLLFFIACLYFSATYLVGTYNCLASLANKLQGFSSLLGIRNKNVANKRGKLSDLQLFT